jgi:hypothetical protein
MRFSFSSTSFYIKALLHTVQVAGHCSTQFRKLLGILLQLNVSGTCPHVIGDACF